jgi:hypothetical protein
LYAGRWTTKITVGLTLLYSAPALSWWLLPRFGLSILNTETLDRRMRRSRRPSITLRSARRRPPGEDDAAALR